MGSKQAIFLVIFNSLQIVFGSAANMLEILFFSKNRHVYNSVSDKLTLNLAIADFVALTTHLPWRTYLLHIQRRTADSKYYTSLFVFRIFNTGNAIVLIGIDRFIYSDYSTVEISCFSGWQGISTWSNISLGYSISVGYWSLSELQRHTTRYP